VGVSVFVMPLGTNLRGNFQAPGMTRRRRSEEEVEAALEAFRARLETLLGFRPEWDEEGPVRSAMIFSVDAFSLPFQRARAWSSRLKLPRLCALELPQIWLPVDFDPAFHIDSPWEVSVASSARLQKELERLLAEMAVAEGADLGETCRVADRLRQIAELSAEHRVPVIIEG
jgi:hypothetical protein